MPNTPQVPSRSFPASSTWLGIAVRVLIRDDSGRLLLVQRPSTDSRPLDWEFPGGKSDPGENPVDAARRETFEETSLDVEITGLLGATEGRFGDGRTINLAFHARVLSGNLTLSGEHAAHAWTDSTLRQSLPLTPDTQSLLRLLLIGVADPTCTHPLQHP